MEEFIFQRISETVTPIFDIARGRRMRAMRMALILDQRQLGEKLGTSQQMIAKLELGQIKVGRQPIVLATLYRVFGCATHHILFGLDAEKFNYDRINAEYWKQKDRGKGDRTSTRLTRSQRAKSRSAYAAHYRRKGRIPG